SELTGAERQQIARRAVELHARQGLWQIDYQGVLRPPTARERGEEIQRGVQEIRGKGIALSLEILGGIEALTAAKMGLVAVEARVATEGIGTGVVANEKLNFVGEVVTKPESLWGKSAGEIAAGFKEAGYKATVRTSRSGKAQIIEVSGHPEVSQIQVHPGGGRHG